MGGKIMRRNEGRDGGLDAPDAADVFSDLVRVRTLELGELRGAFDLEEYLIPGGRDKLDRANLVSAPVSPHSDRTQGICALTFTSITWSYASDFTSGSWDSPPWVICRLEM